MTHGRKTALALALMLLAFGADAQAQTAEERARIGRLQSARTACPAQPVTQEEQLACSQRAMVREISKQDGYCWSAPNQTGNSLPYRCTARTLK